MYFQTTCNDLFLAPLSFEIGKAGESIGTCTHIHSLPTPLKRAELYITFIGARVQKSNYEFKQKV